MVEMNALKRTTSATAKMLASYDVATTTTATSVATSPRTIRSPRAILGVTPTLPIHGRSQPRTITSTRAICGVTPTSPIHRRSNPRRSLPGLLKSSPSTSHASTSDSEALRNLLCKPTLSHPEWTRNARVIISLTYVIISRANCVIISHVGNADRSDALALIACPFTMCAVVRC